ncbi:MAG: Hsp70 family protein [Deltaproteobacteria bacterium]|nr:Hsp70 family protein [Deltaproteobacteria bacterium]
MKTIDDIKQDLCRVRDSSDGLAVRRLLVGTARELPKTVEHLDLFKLGFSLLDKITNPEDRRMALLEFAKEIPSAGPFRDFYSMAMEEAVIAADGLEEQYRRLTELLRLARELPRTGDFARHRLLAWRLALNLPDKPRYFSLPIEKVADELPKSSDIEFYRKYTLMGVIKELQRDGSFPELYKEAIAHAIAAALTIKEPYYRKYTLLFIARELPKTGEYIALFKQAITEAYRAATETSDQFAREYALFDILEETPKTVEFYPLLNELFEQALSFFTMRKWVGDLEVLDVVDYIISAEDMTVTESKKRRFTRERYAKLITAELEKLGPRLNDIRFIDTLKPYVHVWVQPRFLREAIKKVVDHLESLKGAFHGREIKRPVFAAETHPEGIGDYIHKKEPAANECVAIDLGATNTVVVRKKGPAKADFVPLSPLSRQYDGVYLIPSVLSASTNTIGADVTEENPVANFKQMLLDGHPKGRESMERFFRILYQHLKKAISTGGWFSFAKEADVIYITAPVGYQDYRKAIREIAGGVIKGIRVDIIDEPLAAAVGYQVAEDADKVIMIVDFGGSTLNTMLLRLNMDAVHVVAKPERAQMLGGHDIDGWLAEYLAGKAGIPSTEAPFEWNGREVCRVTREEFEEVLDGHEFYRLVDRTISHVLKRAEKVGVRKDKIEAVLLTGGSSQIPSFREKIGDIFPELRDRNLIYDHSPLSAVGMGAALYGTRDVTDRHLGMAYALRYVTDDSARPHSYGIILEKGEMLPLEKTYSLTPARRLSVQNDIFLELFEVPDELITRMWVMEGGIEFIKQEIKHGEEAVLRSLKTITLSFKEPIEGDVSVTFRVDEKGLLTIRYGIETLDTGLALH